MNRKDLEKLLTYIQAGDNRTLTAVDVVMWDQALPGSLTLDTAIAAVTMHRQESTAWLMPAHVIANVRTLNAELARERARLSGIEASRRRDTNSPSGPPWWFRKLVEASRDEYRRQVAAGHPPQPDKFGKYPNDRRSVPELLAHYGIVREPGDGPDRSEKPFRPVDYMKD